MEDCKLYNCENTLTYEDLKDLITFRMAGKKRKENLENLLYKDMGHGMYIFYVIEADRKSSLLVSKKILEALEVTEDQVFKDAMRNTQRKYRPLLKSVEEAIVDTMSKVSKQGNMLDYPISEFNCVRDQQMYVLTNVKAKYGATVIFYDNLLEKVSNFFNGDFYMIPSSVHEFILLPASSKVGVKRLNTILNDVNKDFVDEEDILGENVLYYNSKEGKIM